MGQRVRARGRSPAWHTWWMQGQQKRWPHWVTTGLVAVSKQMLHWNMPSAWEAGAAPSALPDADPASAIS